MSSDAEKVNSDPAVGEAMTDDSKASRTSVAGDDHTHESTETADDGKPSKHTKQDSGASYNSIASSSSSSSSVQYAEANSGDNTVEVAPSPSRSRTPSLDNKFSTVSLDSTAPTSKSTSMTLDTSTELEKRASMASNATGSSVDKAVTGDGARDRTSTLSEGTPSKRVSLAIPETPSSPHASETHNDSLLKQQLDAHAAEATEVEDARSDRWRDSVVEGTTASAMDTVALSDSRPSSEVFEPLANDFSSSFQEVEIPLGTTPPVASTSTLTAGTSPNGKHLSANGTNMQRSPTRQSTASSTHNYDLIQQRAETHHADLEGHPKRHRRTLRGSQDLRANFDKLREEMNTPAPDSPGNDSPPKGAPSDPPTIDWDFWGEVMNDYEGIAKTRPRDLSKAIQNGIPSALRGMMWQLMSASKDPDLEATYSQLLRLPSTHEKAIIRDLNRTFPTHEYFHDKAGVGQNNLLNIMKAYSLYDDEVGYCQGMAFVVGPLLLNMPDEEAFCVLVRLMKSYDLRSQYIPDMPGLQLRLYQFDRLLEELLPAVFMHLLRQGIKSSMYASQWFLTLLAYRFPLELVCAVFDLIFAEGVEAIFRFALAVMKRNEDKIVQLEFEQVLEFLKTGLFEEYKHQMEEGSSSDDHPTYSVQMFVKEALQVKITPMMLDQYTSEWTEMCRQQNAQSAEVEQLRAINKKLSHQVRHLEASLAQINQEHCELVKQVVATRLEKEELEDELVRVKMALAQESLLREEGRGSIASRGSYASYTSSSGPYSPREERRDSQLSIPK